MIKEDSAKCKAGLKRAKSQGSKRALSKGIRIGALLRAVRVKAFLKSVQKTKWRK